MTTPTPTPTPEAVEAAMKYAMEDPTGVGGHKAWHVFVKATREYVPCDLPSSHCAARILAAEVERLRANEDEGCEWRGDCDYWAWETKCGSTFTFESGGPKENGIAFCPGCGRKVKIQTNDK